MRVLEMISRRVLAPASEEEIDCRDKEQVSQEIHTPGKGRNEQGKGRLGSMDD